MAYNYLNQFLYHYCSVLEICILLTRMKLFNPNINKYFSLTPKKTSILLFFVCALIDLPFFFSVTIGSLGEFYYVDVNNARQNATFYRIVNSEFSASLVGQLSLTTSYVLDIVFTLVVGVTLNVVSMRQYAAYVKRRACEAEDIQKRIDNIQPSALSKTGVKKFPADLQRILDQKESNQRKIEKNMFGMARTLCTISIVSRVILTLGFVVYYITNLG